MTLRSHFRTADFYILKTYMAAFAFVFALFVAIAFILLLFEELETFLSHDVSFGVGLTYVVLRVPHELVKAAPMIVVLAMVSAVGALLRHKEMLMLYIAGYTPVRLSFPLITMMGTLILGLYWFNEYVSGPLSIRANTLMQMRIKGSQEGLTGSLSSGVWIYGMGNRIYRARAFFPIDNRLETLSIFVYQGINQTLSEWIDAESAVWSAEKKYWNLHHVFIHKIQPSGITLTEHQETIAYDIERSPSDFGAVTQNIEQMSHRDLKKLVNNIRIAGENPLTYLPDLYVKEAFPFAVFFLGLLGYAMMIYFGALGKASGIGLGMVAVIMYFMALSLGKSFAQAGVIPPWLGAWGPNLICFFLTLYFFNRLRYEI